MIHGHFLLLQGATQQHCSTRRNGRAGLCSQTSLGCQHGETTDPCSASQTQTLASELPFLETQHTFHYVLQETLKFQGLLTGNYRTSFHLPNLQGWGNQLGPFKKLFYLIKTKLIKSKIESYSVIPSLIS